MKPDDYKYLDTAKAVLIDSAINRMAESGRMQYQFTLSGDEVRQGLGRERLHVKTVEGVVNYFAAEGIAAEHDAARDRFRVTLDLDETAVSLTEAKYLSTAMNKYRLENG